MLQIITIDNLEMVVVGPIMGNILPTSIMSVGV